MGVVYALCDPASGEVRYIGKTIQPLEKRLKQHQAVARAGAHYYVARWIRSLDASPLVRVLEEAEDDASVKAAERAWIAFYREADARLTNLTAGGDGITGLRHSAASKERIRAALLKRPPMPEETRQKISAAKMGYSHPPEVIARISRKLAGRPGVRGRPVSAETREKIRLGALGRPKTTSEIEKIRAAQIGRPKSAATREKLRIATLKQWETRPRVLSVREKCINCDRLADPPRHGRCDRCAAYWRRTGREAPPSARKYARAAVVTHHCADL